MSKKAFIFTLVSFFFVASIFLYVQTQQIEQQIDEIDAETLRVERVTAYVENLEEDYLPLILKIATRTALAKLTDDGLANSVAVGDGSSTFSDEVVSVSAFGNRVGVRDAFRAKGVDDHPTSNWDDWCW